MTSANKVVIFDPHWNPAHDLQAQDRAYRIGQTRDVDVFRMVSAGTIEEIVYARQIYKQQQANIGYTASRERRYFKGVQQQPGRRGEIFGLENLLSYRGDQVMLRDIVNKTNIAEAKAGVTLSDIDLEQGSEDEDEEDRGLHTYIKQEEGDGEDAGLSQLAKLLVAEDQGSAVSKAVERKPQSDAIAAILASAGVEYTHQNSEVIGSSKVEAQLSRRAELAAAAIEGKGHGGGSGLGDVSSRTMGGDSALFADTQANSVPIAGDGKVLQLRYNPPGDVMRRQFCSMAKEFGFASATDFALVVESWTQEQRRDCLDSFYKRRETQLLEMALVGVKDEEKKPVKSEVQQDEQSAPSRWATTIFLSDDDEDDDGEL
ncbi:hypothetical protein P8C59_004552 [Phyllachora maydis]|nr:hypothetical protein P8C59_004552 [Phyllachora maydis]